MKVRREFTIAPFASYVSFFILLLCFVNILLQPADTVARALGNDTDRFALLKFKESISNDPYRVLSSWNDSVHFCKWLGVKCSIRHQRITHLELDFYGLQGRISPYIGNLSFLRYLNLSNNGLSGNIPEQIGRLFRVKVLNFNYNKLEGKIPTNLSYCSEFQFLSLAYNRLTGNIPAELGSLASLELLNLGANNLTGGIPSSLGNISSLKRFALSDNNLVGTIPVEFSRLKYLNIFALGPNFLFGAIPPSLFNLSSMKFFLVPGNKFNGTLPHNIGLTLPNLERFGVADNQFSGTIPESFSNASRLQIFDLGINKFFGHVPNIFGYFPALQWLSLADNDLGINYSTNGLDFMSSLTNCSKLKRLDLSLNELGGVLPNSIANLSTQMSFLYLGYNKISGNIPSSLENLVNLTILELTNNLFGGIIPDSLGKLQNLQVLTLESNILSGKIPFALGNLTRIFILSLSGNELEGTIPRDISNCKRLQNLNISNNKLSGVIPIEVFGQLSLLLSMDLSRNSFSGSIPIEVGKLTSINSLRLSENALTGKIPESIGECQSLEMLYLEGNSFQGAIPSSLASLRGLRYLDLSKNNFAGEVPEDLQKIPLLLYLNLSFNDLEGEVPNQGVFRNTSAISVAGNNKLCGGVPTLQLPACPVKSRKRMSRVVKLTIAITCSVAGFLLLLSFAILYRCLKSSMSPSLVLSRIGFLSKVSYKRLYEATNGFSPSLLIGTGSFGSVYKGSLEGEESPVAIKILNLQRKGASKSFISECNALRHIRHRNLVKVVTCCSSIDYNGNEFKALVFEYMPNGSLDKWLHLEIDDANRLVGLNLTQRFNVAIDVASAIQYLHEDCDQTIIHCDLKPANVLLDDEMIAHIGDFGLARLISASTGVSESKTSTIGIKGTVGYAAPEYAMGCEPSKQGDVYSYGILVLEMFTGRRPTDEMFKDDFNLHNFVKTALPERLVEIVDSALLPREVEETLPSREEHGRNYHVNNRETEIEVEEGSTSNTIAHHLLKCLVSVLQIGVACSKESPNERMNIGDVSGELQRIQKAYLDVGAHGQRRPTG